MSCGSQQPQEERFGGCVCVCVCWVDLQTEEGAAGPELYLTGSPKGQPEPGFREGAEGHILTRRDRKPAWCLSDSRQADCTDLLAVLLTNPSQLGQSWGSW